MAGKRTRLGLACVAAVLAAVAALSPAAHSESETAGAVEGPAPVVSPALRTAQNLFRKGHFRGLLGLETTSEGQEAAAALEALKARAALAEAFRVGLWPRGADWVRRAESHAAEARSLDPASHEGPLLLATALGLTARSMGDLPAFTSGIAERSRALLDEAARLAPEAGHGSGQVMAAQGAWHIDVSRRAGAKLARRLFGADRAEGLRLLRAAAAEAPGDLAVQFEVALALLTIDARAYGAEARDALSRVRAGTPGDGFEALLRDEAGAFLELLALEDRAPLRARLAAVQGYREKDEGGPG